MEPQLSSYQPCYLHNCLSYESISNTGKSSNLNNPRDLQPYLEAPTSFQHKQNVNKTKQNANGPPPHPSAGNQHLQDEFLPYHHTCSFRSCSKLTQPGKMGCSAPRLEICSMPSESLASQEGVASCRISWVPSAF